MPRTLRVIQSRIDAPLNMDKWTERICTPPSSRLFIILQYPHVRRPSYLLATYIATLPESLSEADYGPAISVLRVDTSCSHCPVAWQVPPCSPLPVVAISYYGNNRKFCERLEMVNRVDVIGPGGGLVMGWVGLFTSNLLDCYRHYCILSRY